jgi:hypothetical protein
MSLDGDIWAGDLARAFAVLRPEDDASRTAIARLLGLTTRLAEPASADAGLPGPGQSRTTAPQQPAADEVSGEQARARHSRTLDGLPLLPPVRAQESGLIGWIGGASLPRVTGEQLAGALRHEPLLAPRSAFSFLHALLAQNADDGPVDVAAIVDAVARRQPLDGGIPHEPRATLRFGAELLLDVGEGMEPFLRDGDLLAEQVRRIGGTATQVTYFADCPLRGAGRDSVSSWDRYAPPHPRTKVLVVSDFGIGGPSPRARRSQPGEWRAFSRLLADAQCPVAGLVPYPPARWPASLARWIPLSTWDRGSTVGTVRSRSRP